MAVDCALSGTEQPVHGACPPLAAQGTSPLSTGAADTSQGLVQGGSKGSLLGQGPASACGRSRHHRISERCEHANRPATTVRLTGSESTRSGSGDTATSSSRGSTSGTATARTSDEGGCGH
eukprot:s121_g16.t1